MATYLVLDSTNALVGRVDSLDAANRLAFAIAFNDQAPCVIAQLLDTHAVPAGLGKLTQEEVDATVKLALDALGFVAGPPAPDVHGVGGARPEVVLPITVEEAAAAAATPAAVVEDEGAREIRETELHDMTADEVRAIAKGHGVEQHTKAENIDAILDFEFPG